MKLRLRSTGALFVALVAAILGSMPGWWLTFLAWTVPCWLVLACVTLWTLVLLACAALRRDRIALRAECRQFLELVLVLAITPWLGRLSIGVELAQVRPELIASAEASVRSGGPRLALWSEVEEDVPDHGILYDGSREIDRPPLRRSAAWTSSATGRFLADDCVSTSHLVGPWYRWSKVCGGY
jgi:hypothetical protein